MILQIKDGDRPSRWATVVSVHRLLTAALDLLFSFCLPQYPRHLHNQSASRISVPVQPRVERGPTVVSGYKGFPRPSGRRAAHMFGKVNVGSVAVVTKRVKWFALVPLLGSGTRHLQEQVDEEGLVLPCALKLPAGRPSQVAVQQGLAPSSELFWLSPLFVQAGAPACGALPSIPPWDGVFAPQLNLFFFSSKTYPEVCLLGNLKFSQAGNDYPLGVHLGGAGRVHLVMQNARWSGSQEGQCDPDISVDLQNVYKWDTLCLSGGGVGGQPLL